MKISVKVFCSMIVVGISSMLACAQDGSPRYDVFTFEQQVTLPGSPEQIFDMVTGDIKPWWDHSFSDDPLKLYIEPWPGGGFYEIFDEQGNGAKHATVIYANRGEMLRMEGPLGLSGKAIQLVCTYRFEAKGPDSTILRLNVHGAGEVTEGMPEIVESVWHHFLFERFKPYVENR